jgi:hypothetical protein
LQRCLDDIRHALETPPGNKRLQRFAGVVTIFRLMLQRHADKIVDAQDLAGTAAELKRRYAGGLSVAPRASDNGRQSGGLVPRARDKGAAGGPADPSAAAAVAAKPDAAGTAA